jgi:hypothetical protein
MLAAMAASCNSLGKIGSCGIERCMQVIVCLIPGLISASNCTATAIQVKLVKLMQGPGTKSSRVFCRSEQKIVQQLPLERQQTSELSIMSKMVILVEDDVLIDAGIEPAIS